MPTLYNLIEPYDDELLYSWLHRLAEANAFNDSFSMFKHTFILPGAGSRTDVRYDDLYFLGNVFSAAHLKAEEIYNLLDQHSMYGAMTPFYTEGAQAWQLLLRFYAYRKYPMILQSGIGTISELHYCPECQKEDAAKYGKMYPHRIHQIPGMKVCPKHGCLLTSSINMDDTDIPAEWKIAKFAQEWFSRGFDMNCKELFRVIRTRAKELQYARKMGGKEQLEHDLQNSFLKNAVNIKFLKSHYMDSKVYSSHVHDILAVLLFLFHDVDTFVKYADPVIKEYSTSRFEQAAAEAGYTVVGNVRRKCTVLRHNDCGHIMVTCPAAFLMGFDCPRCNDRSEQDMAAHLVKTAGNDEYTLVSNVSEMRGHDNTVQIRHEVCGSTNTIRLNTFLFHGIRCSCAKLLTKEEAQKFINAVPGFHLVKYTSGSAPMTIHHDQCGRDFVTRMSNFRERPQCPFCDAGKMLLSDFQKRIDELSGPGYTVLPPYQGTKKPVKIRHEVCGRTGTYRVNYILKAGCHCRFCKAADRGRMDVVLNSIKELWKPGDVFKNKDIPRSGMSEDNFRHVLNDLVNSGDIVLLKRGYYILAGSNVDAYKVVDSAYVMRDGKRFGYHRGRLFAYDIGLITEKPEIISVASNTVKTAMERYSVLGHLYTVKGTKIEVNDDNYMEIAILDLLVYMNLQQDDLGLKIPYQTIHHWLDQHGYVPRMFLPYLDLWGDGSAKREIRKAFTA